LFEKIVILDDAVRLEYAKPCGNHLESVGATEGQRVVEEGFGNILRGSNGKECTNR